MGIHEISVKEVVHFRRGETRDRKGIGTNSYASEMLRIEEVSCLRLLPVHHIWKLF